MSETQTPAALDRDAFRRVWQRVMPEDRADCPFTVDAPAVPDTAPLQPIPQAPIMPRFMSRQTPAARPMSAIPTVCLGEGSCGELPMLSQLVVLTVDGLRVYRALSRRWRREALPADLAAAKQRQARRLSAAHFLISGRSYEVPASQIPRFDSLPLALRDRHRAEQEAALAFFQAANTSADPCLIELYREMGRENQLFAGRIRERLEMDK